MLEHYGLKADLRANLLMDETAPDGAPYLFWLPAGGLEHDEDNPMALVMTPQHLELRKRRNRNPRRHFRRFCRRGRGRTGASLAAGAAKRWRKPSVSKVIICRMWSMPRRLGRDAFVLLCPSVAARGCWSVIRWSPALLDDGSTRGYADAILAAGFRSVCSRFMLPA